MKILLTGVTGFLGSNLAVKLIRLGHTVIGMKRRSSCLSRLEEVNSQIAYVNSDEGLYEFFNTHNDFNLIIHAATSYGNNGELTSDVIAANVVMPLHLLEWAISRGNCPFLNADSFFCKPNNGYSYLSEYTASKSFFHKIGSELAHSSNSIFCNMRIEHMYGAGDSDTKFATRIVKQLINNVDEINLTPGLQKRDFVYIDDVVDAFVQVVHAVEDNSLQGVISYDIGSGETYTVREFVTMAHQISASKSKLNFDGMPYRTDEIMYSCANLDAISSLGWYPKVKLRDGLEKLISTLNTSL